MVTAHAMTGSPSPVAPLAAVVDVHKSFARRRGLLSRPHTINAVNGVSLDIGPGETLGLVGESGCGKSTLGRLFLGLLQPTSGDVLFEGQNLLHLPRTEMKRIRSGMQAVFQDPLGSLNPRMSVEDILLEPLEIHRIDSAAGRAARIRRLLDVVGLPDDTLRRKPYEFSGGQQQRIAVARALVLDPRLLVADEALSALDVSIQAQILNLFLEIQQQLGVSFLFISHNLVVVRHVAQRIAVMYLGTTVELGPSDAVYRRPRHPYTLALLSAVPVPDPVVERRRRRISLSGDPPSPARIPSGCPFRTRCWKAQEICATERPPLRRVEADVERSVACHFPE
jgi:oligopeptide/dipeptide ABC transporter ATP-binding protein